MAYVPVPLIPGVTIAAVYEQFAVSPPWSSGTTAVQGVDWDVDPDTGVITFLRSMLGGWMRFTFSDAGGTIAGSPEAGAVAARLTADVSATVGGAFDYDMASRLASTHNDQIVTTTQQQTGVYDGTNFDIAAGSDGSFNTDPVGITLLFELDITLAPDEFWTDKVNCFEDTDNDLVKPPQPVFVPEVEGQPYLPASFNCYPPPPPPPPTGDDPPEGGNGSGPPHGDCYDVPVYESFFLCSGYPPGDPLAVPPCLPSTIIVGYVQVCP